MPKIMPKSVTINSGIIVYNHMTHCEIEKNI